MFSIYLEFQKLFISVSFASFPVFTKLIVIGGYYDHGDISSVELVDLEDPSNSCYLADYPLKDGEMAVGLVSGLVKSCGGSQDYTDACYDYDPATNSWTESTSMLSTRYTPRESTIDGIWLVSDDSPSTEMWTGNGFEQGPSLPQDLSLYHHCQLTVNSTHVFFGDTHFLGPNYLLDWSSQTWTQLPPMTMSRDYPSCGMINNPENGLEAVIVEDGASEIFNFNDLTWRAGPDGPYIYDAGYAQLPETFVVVGGYDLSQALDTIYQFDNVNYDWIQKDQRLQTPRDNYPGVVAVPGDFISCP